MPRETMRLRLRLESCHNESNQATIKPTMEKSRENEQKSLLRASSELEGTLLLPTARPVSDKEDDLERGSAPPLTMATACPDSYFDYNQDEEKKASETIIVAPTIPTVDQQLHNSLRDRMQLSRAAQKGLIDADQEMEEISKANRKVNAINYFTKQQIREAELKGKTLNVMEETGQTQTSKTVPLDAPVPEPVKVDQEHFEGTFGKEYDVSSYEIGTYDTTEYEVSAYKSVYER